MFNLKQLESLANDLYNALPPSLQQVEKNIQQQFKDILHAAFSSIDLVTREEFDVQAKVLARTRQKVEALQARVETLIANQENKAK